MRGIRRALVVAGLATLVSRLVFTLHLDKVRGTTEAGGDRIRDVRFREGSVSLVDPYTLFGGCLPPRSIYIYIYRVLAYRARFLYRRREFRPPVSPRDPAAFLTLLPPGFTDSQRHIPSRKSGGDSRFYQPGATAERHRRIRSPNVRNDVSRVR